MKLIHVPYKGSGPALVDLLGGQINLMFTSTTSGAAHVKSGKLRGIAVTSPTRLAVYPELPTLAETVAPGYELGNNYSMFAPAGTPKPTLNLLNTAISRVVHSPELRDKFAADGATPAPAVNPDKFREMYVREVERWEAFKKKLRVQP
jgi:tripartite-type tricarboxylate transporter receptor subunit TctC